MSLGCERWSGTCPSFQDTSTSLHLGRLSASPVFLSFFPLSLLSPFFPSFNSPLRCSPALLLKFSSFPKFTCSGFHHSPEKSSTMAEAVQLQWDSPDFIAMCQSFMARFNCSEEDAITRLQDLWNNADCWRTGNGRLTKQLLRLYSSESQMKLDIIHLTK